VKDKEKLASDIIPQFFKHNKWSSFVRQLNFYGFRKVRPGTLLLNENEELKEWCFRHNHFKRGRTDLLKEIRKPSQTVAGKEEVEALKREIVELKAKLNTLSDQVQVLTGLVEASLEDKENKTSKTRKMQPPQSVLVTSSCDLNNPSALSGSPPQFEGLDQGMRGMFGSRLSQQGGTTSVLCPVYPEPNINLAANDSTKALVPFDLPCHDFPQENSPASKKQKVETSSIAIPSLVDASSTDSKNLPILTDALDSDPLLADIALSLIDDSEEPGTKPLQTQSVAPGDDFFQDMISTEDLFESNSVNHALSLGYEDIATGCSSTENMGIKSSPTCDATN